MTLVGTNACDNLERSTKSTTAVDENDEYIPVFDIAYHFEMTCSDNARTIIERRYLMRDPKDLSKIVETPADMVRRVSRRLADIEKETYEASEEHAEKWYGRFLDIIGSRRGTPAGRTLANAGNSTARTFAANCVVLHIEDSLKHILKTQTEAGLLQQAGAGVGFPWHGLRPAGEPVVTSQSESSGPVSFLRMYNSTFLQIKQQNRHGANMAVMRVDHPDILEFVNCKRKEGSISCFNISVGLTDEFMRQVCDEKYHNVPWVCQFNGKEYPVRRITRTTGYNRSTNIENTDMSALDLFNAIVDAAWSNGEPGVVFLDTVNDSNPLPGLGRIESCNPCGEQFLHDGDICNLGHVNLAAHVDEKGKLDESKLVDTVEVMIRMLDNVVDCLQMNSKRVQAAIKGNRRLGLGVMGVADMLYAMKLRYASDDAVQVCERAMYVIQQASEYASEMLAVERGNFPNYDKSVYAQTGRPRRNAALTSVAPTGTTALAMDVNGGIEPFFSLGYTRNVGTGNNAQTLYYFNETFRQVAQACGMHETHEAMEHVASTGSVHSIPESIMLPKDFADARHVFCVAPDLTPEEHVKMQTAFQKHCDNAISKTINFPNSATRDDIAKTYMLAWQNKCKGCTIYRDGSRTFQILTTANESGNDDDGNGESGAASASSSSELISSDDGGSPRPRHELNTCPDCGATPRMAEGCSTCDQCGWSACGTPKRK